MSEAEAWYRVYDARYQEPTAVFAGPKSACEKVIDDHPYPEYFSMELWD